MIRDVLRRRRGEVDDRLQASVDELSTLLAREGRARAEFIGKVSHELRTPLTVIKGYVYTLHRSESDPAKAAKLDVIKDVVARFGDAPESALGERVARALVSKGSCSVGLDRSEEAIDVFNDVVGRFSDARARAAYASREVREAERLASG